MKHGKGLYIIILVLTVFDVFLTVYGYRIGILEEANPVMAGFIHNAPEISGIAILIMVSAILYLFWKVRGKIAWLTKALAFLCVCKTVLFFYEITGYIISL
jgi:hypothetical protein